ncbi:MAG: M42 family metallopeptidase [Tissierellia bacterium]|nr:M42 family metallopeptidase [Tissierellia bacterium]
MKNTIRYIEKLTSIPSPTGFTKEIMTYVFNKGKELNLNTQMTRKGGVLITVKGQDDDKHRMLTAHLDSLGAMVKEIKEDGRLKLSKVGGYNFHTVEGENCKIHTFSNKVYSGTILMHQTSSHVYADADTAKRNEDNIEVRIDEKTFSAEDTRKLGIEVGDFISFDPRTSLTESGFIKSRHLDDKVSAAILLDILEKISNDELKLKHTTHFYFSNNEEIGYGANSSIPEEVIDYLAVDMGALGDGQTSDEYTVSICAKDSSGPYNYELRSQLVNLAKDYGVEYRVDIYPFYGSDASAAMRAGADVRHALLGAGIESSHSYERTHIDSVRHTQRLVELFLESEIA